jgi:hypothetical protein
MAIEYSRTPPPLPRGRRLMRVGDLVIDWRANESGVGTGSN